MHVKYEYCWQCRSRNKVSLEFAWGVPAKAARRRQTPRLACGANVVCLSLHGVFLPGRRRESGGLQWGAATPALYCLAGTQSEGGNTSPLALESPPLVVVSFLLSLRALVKSLVLDKKPDWHLRKAAGSVDSLRWYFCSGMHCQIWIFMHFSLISSSAVWCNNRIMGYCRICA